MDSGAGIALLEPVPRMDIFLAAFDEMPDPRADNARHDLCELLVLGPIGRFVRKITLSENIRRLNQVPQSLASFMFNGRAILRSAGLC